MLLPMLRRMETNSVDVSPDLPDWERSLYQPGGGDAFLFFAVYGQFQTDLQISGSTYRTAGVPEGVDVRKLDRAQSPDFPFDSGPIGKLLEPEQPALFAAIQEVPEGTIIQGVVPDPPDLNYLRDTAGLVMYFLDHGGNLDDPDFNNVHVEIRWPM